MQLINCISRCLAPPLSVIGVVINWVKVLARSAHHSAGGRRVRDGWNTMFDLFSDGMCIWLEVCERFFFLMAWDAQPRYRHRHRSLFPYCMEIVKQRCSLIKYKKVRKIAVRYCTDYYRAFVFKSMIDWLDELKMEDQRQKSLYYQQLKYIKFFLIMICR